MKIIKLIGRIFITIAITLAGIILACLVLVFLMVKGPSEAAKNLFVRSVNETSRLGFISRIFLSEQEVKKIMDATSTPDIEKGVISDTAMVEIDTEEAKNHEAVEIEEITGSGYHGYLMTVYDPSKVFVGTVPAFGTGEGQTVVSIIDTYNAAGYDIIAGVNGGDFIDLGEGSADTSQPLGAVYSEGSLVYSENGRDYEYHLAGFNNENKFIMGYMTLDKAEELGIRDALYCIHNTGPFLILNGEMLLNEVPDGTAYGGGKNPRTAIGQRADGAVLMMVIDGRQANSLGATFEDLARIMNDAGAVNACAMDGGTSSQMIFEGEVINHPYSPFGPRKCPTAWLVSR